MDRRNSCETASEIRYPAPPDRAGPADLSLCLKGVRQESSGAPLEGNRGDTGEVEGNGTGSAAGFGPHFRVAEGLPGVGAR